MAVNYVNSGERIMYIIPHKPVNITSGQIVVLENKIFVALSTGTTGDEISLSRCGRFALKKAADKIAQGQTIYFNKEHRVMTTISAGNIKAGISATNCTSEQETVDCILITNH